MMTGRRLLYIAAGLLAGTAIAFAATMQSRAGVRVTTAIEWADRGVWLRGDFHTQSRFSDGGTDIEGIVDAAARFGCDVVAITDHGDGGLKGGTPEYFEAIRAARTAHPATTVIAGLEWNVPPGKGQEHANLFIPSALEDAATWTSFKERFDDENKEGENPELALAGFKALQPPTRDALPPVFFFNHPSRRPSSTSAPQLTLAALKKAAPAIVMGFEGAPGHQKATPLGAFNRPEMLVDRWDPFVAIVNGTWDGWLGEGMNLWAALASADFHEPGGDFWPCEFARTHVYAPDRTVDGVIRALRAGSFFAEHGHIVDNARLEVRFDGQSHVFQPGEVAAAPRGSVAIATLSIDVPAVDYLQRENRIDLVELIGVTKDGARVLHSGPPASAEAFKVPVPVPAGGIVLRARGRRALGDGPGLAFYTNPIRITS